MAERITQAWLNKRVGLLNDMLGRPKTQYTKKAGGGLTGNKGHLFIDHAYSGVKVAMMAGNGTGEHNISDGYVPKRELNNFINGMIAGVREAQAGRKQNPAKRKTPGYDAGFKLAKGKRKMAKKKRSAKQLANDKRLGRMAKARAKKKRGGRRKKVAKRKVTKRRVVRKRNVVRRGFPKSIAKRKTRAKSHLWLIFRVYGNSVAFYNGGYPISNRWGTKGKAAFYQTKEQARKLASTLRVSPRVNVGICSADSTIHDIRKGLQEGKI